MKESGALILVLGLLVQCSLATNVENNNDQPAIENETIQDITVTESAPDPITIKPPGSTEELRPNLVGLANMAIVHLPQRLTFDYVIRATREIVDGVRYELIVNTKDISKTEVICRLVVMEKPWITTEAGDKFRELINSNCTATSEDDKYDPSKYEGNTVFNSSNTEVTHGELSDLETQILAGKDKKPTTIPKEEATDEEGALSLGIIRGVEVQIVPQTTTTDAPSLSEDSFAFLSSLFGMDSAILDSFSTAVSDVGDAIVPDVQMSTSLPLPSTVSVETIEMASASTPKDMSEDSKLFLDSIFMKPAIEPEHTIVHATQPSNICDNVQDTTRAVGASHIVQTSLAETGDEQVIEKEPIGTLTPPSPDKPSMQSVQEEFKNIQASNVDENQSITSRIANPTDQNQQDSMTRLHESNNGERNVGDVNIKSIHDEITEVIASPNQSGGNKCSLKLSSHVVAGGIREIPSTEYSQLEEQVTTAIKAATTISGNEDGIESMSKIYCASRQVVAGTLEKIHGQFITADGTKKECIMEIWSRLWLPEPERTQLSLDCTVADKGPNRKRRSLNENRREIFDRVQEFLPAETVRRANGQPLFTKVNEIYVAKEGKDDSDYKYEIQGNFEMPDGDPDICEMNLVQQSNRLNTLHWQCVDDDTEFVFSFYPSVLTIPHSKRTKEQKLFAKFIKNNNREYAHTPEEDVRFNIFNLNLQKIKMFNEMEQGTAKYGITELADLTEDEYFMRTGLRYNDHVSDSNHIRNPMAEIPDIELPKSFDWREKGAITQVKNQGACGSCWAFSVTGNIEGIHAVKTGKLEEYSEQELVDCDSVDHGCAGGLPDNAYKAIENIGGLELEDEYPYKGRQSKCAFNKTMSHVKVKGAIDFPKNETAMALWLVQNGPISIGINANAMQFYRGGISHPWRMLCRHTGIDHGVLIVGFGVSDYPVFNKTIPYWIVKNSWGKKWGEQGYYRVYRGDDTCGVGEMASSAVLAD